MKTKTSFFGTILLLYLLAYSSCNFDKILPPPKIPHYQFDYTFPVKDIREAGCVPGLLEEQIDDLNKVEKSLLVRFAGRLTPHELEQLSLKFHSQILTDFDVIENDDTELLRNILKKLIKVVDQHGIVHPDWKIFLVQSKSGFSIINAWTTGSYVYFSTNLVEICKHEPGQLAVIAGHEIYHSINQDVSALAQRDSLAQQYFGERWGKVVLEVYQRYLASPMGQGNELRADLGALVIMYEAGYDPVDGIKPFKKFAEIRDRDPTVIERLLSDHPLDDTRINCIAGAVERARINSEQQTELTSDNN